MLVKKRNAIINTTTTTVARTAALLSSLVAVAATEDEEDDEEDYEAGYFEQYQVTTHDIGEVLPVLTVTIVSLLFFVPVIWIGLCGGGNSNNNSTTSKNDCTSFVVAGREEEEKDLDDDEQYYDCSNNVYDECDDDDDDDDENNTYYEEEGDRREEASPLLPRSLLGSRNGKKKQHTTTTTTTTTTNNNNNNNNTPYTKQDDVSSFPAVSLEYGATSTTKQKKPKKVHQLSIHRHSSMSGGGGGTGGRERRRRSDSLPIEGDQDQDPNGSSGGGRRPNPSPEHPSFLRLCRSDDGHDKKQHQHHRHRHPNKPKNTNALSPTKIQHGGGRRASYRRSISGMGNSIHELRFRTGLSSSTRRRKQQETLQQKHQRILHKENDANNNNNNDDADEAEAGSVEDTTTTPDIAVRFAHPNTTMWEKVHLICCTQNCCDDGTETQAMFAYGIPYLVQAISGLASEWLQVAIIGHQLGPSQMSTFITLDLFIRLTSDFVHCIISSAFQLVTQIADIDDDDDDDEERDVDGGDDDAVVDDEDVEEGEEYDDKQKRKSDNAANNTTATTNSKKGNAGTRRIKTTTKIGFYVQLGIVFYSIAYIPVLVFWSFYSKELLLFLKFDPEFAELGQQFATPYCLSIGIGGVSAAIQYMMDVVELQNQSTVLTFFGEVLTTSWVAIILIYDHDFFPDTVSLIDLGYAYLFITILYLSVLLGLLYSFGWLQPYYDGFFASPIPSLKKAFSSMVSSSSSPSSLSSSSSFSTSTKASKSTTATTTSTATATTTSTSNTHNNTAMLNGNNCNIGNTCHAIFVDIGRNNHGNTNCSNNADSTSAACTAAIAATSAIPANNESPDGEDDASIIATPSAIKLMISTAFTYAISGLLSSGQWQAFIFFASKLGSAEVAAWGLLGIIWEELDYVINAIAEGCVIRCAISLGAGRVHTAKYVAYKSLWICFIWGMAVTVILVVFANEIPALLTPSPVLQAMVAKSLPVMAVANAFCGVGIMVDHILSVQNRAGAATKLGLAASLLITLPLGAISSIVFDLNLIGLASSISIGSAAFSAAATYLMIRSDWKGISDDIIGIHGYDDDDNGDESENDDGSSYCSSNNSCSSDNTKDSSLKSSWRRTSPEKWTATEEFGYTKRDKNSGWG